MVKHDFFSLLVHSSLKQTQIISEIKKTFHSCILFSSRGGQRVFFLKDV